VVAVFQHGWFNGLVGLERPFSAIPLEVPMMVFCLSFGLSMDYELFLLFRIKREYAIDQDNERATIAGLVSRGARHHGRRASSWRPYSERSWARSCRC
jgi:RND superfamily putative drug exporter